MGSDRFWAKVDKTGECWLWTASMDRYGYGQLRLKGTLVYAHRHVLMLEGVEIAGLQVDHVCHTPACVNPAHLRPVTKKQNMENRGPTRRSKTGIRGVRWDSGRRRWVSQVGHNGQHFSKRFTDLADAEAWVLAKRLELFTHNDADRAAA